MCSEDMRVRYYMEWRLSDERRYYLAEAEQKLEEEASVRSAIVRDYERALSHKADEVRELQE